jgi:hypothetical protein
MKSEKISLIINQICKEQKIDYTSNNAYYISLLEDAQKLSKFYLQIKEMMGIIKEIEERHEVNGLRSKFEKILTELNSIDHLIIKVARELAEKELKHD